MIHYSDFIQKDNASTAWNAVLKTLRENNDHTIVFSEGTYHFYPEECTQQYCYFSNNDEGMKTIAICLENLDNVTLTGNHSKLIFHGRISPIYAKNCCNLHIEGLTIDFEDSFVSDANLIRRENGLAWFQFPGKHQVANGRLRFTDDIYDNLSGDLQFYAYDESKKELVFDKPVIHIPNKNILLQDGLVGVTDHFVDAGTTAFVVKHELRLCPGMVFDGCKNISVSEITLHHAAGMGLLMQNCENCSIKALNVSPHNRRASVSDDALHITDCRGTIRIENCRLSGTLDDSINIHGVYRKLKSRIPGGKFYYLEAGHYQQQGVFGIHAGDTLELLKRQTGKPYARLQLTKVSPISKAFCRIVFDETQLPADFEQGDPAWILETQAELKIVNTVCSPLNGRGILASGMKNVHIAGCEFHTPGSGVFISGDYGFWYETGPVAYAMIENNIFDNCNYRVHTSTQEPLAVFPELNTLPDDFYYHGQMIIRGNHFRSAKRTLISVRSTACVELTNNEYIPDASYSYIPHANAGYSFCTAKSGAMDFQHCKNIRIAGNIGFW